MSRSANDRPRPASLAEPHRWLVVVAYDITQDKRRTRIANTILGYGGRIQGSVYELWLTEQQIERLWGALGHLVKTGDLLRMYLLCAACRQRIRSYGIEEPSQPVGFIV